MMSVSRETLVSQYVELLLRWNGTVKLSSAGTATIQGFTDHIEDSLSLVDHLPPGLERLIDLGSGQGFPAIPVAIATGIQVDMIEADRRKAAFLTTVLATLGLRGTVIPDRIERAAIAPAPCVTARALAPLRKLIALSDRLVAPGGWCLFLKGPAADGEIADVLDERPLQITALPTSRPRSTLVKITGLR